MPRVVDKEKSPMSLFGRNIRVSEKKPRHWYAILADNFSATVYHLFYKAAPTASQTCKQPWKLDADGEAAMNRVADPNDDFGRPTAPSQLAEEVDLDTIRRLREANRQQPAHV